MGWWWWSEGEDEEGYSHVITTEPATPAVEGSVYIHNYGGSLKDMSLCH